MPVLLALALAAWLYIEVGLLVISGAAMAWLRYRHRPFHVRLLRMRWLVLLDPVPQAAPAGEGDAS